MNPRSDLATELTQDNSRVASEQMHENMRAAGDVTAQVCAELIIRNAGTVQQALQSGAEIVVRMTDYSAANINTIVKSNVDLVEVTQATSRDCMRFAQEGIENMVSTFRCLLRYRAPQHLVDFQEKVVRGSTLLITGPVPERGSAI